MASDWNHSSFMPSPTTKKQSNNQYVMEVATGCRRIAPHVKLADRSILVRRTKFVQQLKHKAGGAVGENQDTAHRIDVAFIFLTHRDGTQLAYP
ncbi:hypothetical protein [Bradyrhizobium zhanjiangense]|uniref:hypothetical protein n=1 Tax=Bradyrhizobium zhanjiangense TaxID=1325107 RepID=UPI001008B7B6|nr:hypothetical protein [Bradyrhizobium zhanjiangense]